MLKRLEGADGRSELPARLEILHGNLPCSIHDTDRFRAERCDREIDHPFDERQRAAGFPDKGVAAYAHIVEANLRSA